MEDEVKWIDLPDPAISVVGLPWYEQNAPRLWRLPAESLDRMPEGVRRQAAFPAGARIRLSTDAARLYVRARSVSESAGQAHGLDLYVDGSFWHTVSVAAAELADITCFEVATRQERHIDLYLPHRREVEIAAIGVDDAAHLAAVPAATPPIVLYGSSVAQGAGASRPAMGYGSILARSLGLDLVNLGFGGAGRAEPEVVDMVAAVESCCHLFDLGKSYGRQDATSYVDMLRHTRASPMICITPIYSSREAHDPEYADLSQHTRDVVLRAAEALRHDGKVTVVDGLHLLGPDDADGLSSDGVHPSDLGFQRMAERLEPYVCRDVGDSPEAGRITQPGGARAGRSPEWGTPTRS